MRTVYLLFFLALVIRPIYSEYCAVVCVPVADAIGAPLLEKNYATVFKNLALMGAQTPSSCLRIHQLLFHEVVTVIGEKNNQLQIQVPNTFYQNDQIGKKYSSFWIEKKQVVRLDMLETKMNTLKHLPSPISYTQHRTGSRSVMSLKHPFYEPTTRLHFSAGTRFVVAGKKTEQNTYPVWLLDPQKHRLKTIELPARVILHTPKLSERRTCLVRLLKEWAHPLSGYIPYVWGGASYVYTTDDEHILIKKFGFYRPEYRHQPYTGFDCSGLILRAAQLCNIPYYYKNTATLEKNLPPITQFNEIKDGDLIWHQGHVMIVSSLKDNTLIEASGYPNGFGKVHEIPLSNKFDQVTTYAHLIEKINQNQLLNTIKRDGSIAKPTTVKLLSIEPLLKLTDSPALSHPHTPAGQASPGQ